MGAEFTVQTRASNAANAASRWQEQYDARADKEKLEIGKALVALGSNPKPDDVDRIIGNQSWTACLCSVCSVRSEAAVSFDVNDEYAVSICAKCLAAAHDLLVVRSPPKPGDMGASVKELIEKAEKVAAMGTRGPLGTGVFSGEDKLVWSDGLAGQTVAVCTVPADAQKFVAAVELLPALAVELRRLTEWRPIAEAPRDGSRIQGWCPGYGARELFWDGEAWALVGIPGYSYQPTHFRPLPEGPR